MELDELIGLVFTFFFFFFFFFLMKQDKQMQMMEPVWSIPKVSQRKLHPVGRGVCGTAVDEWPGTSSMMCMNSKVTSLVTLQVTQKSLSPFSIDGKVAGVLEHR